jgi:uncharacterized protein YcnI
MTERHEITMKPFLLAAVCAASILVAPAARAHVVVSPNQVTAGASATFEMRVPTEKNVPTTRIRLLIPDEFAFSSMEPVARWKIKIERSGDRVTAIEARGNLRADFFQRFVFRGRASAPGTLVWKAIQTYRDGSVVRYTGDPGEESASTTTVMPPAP